MHHGPLLPAHGFTAYLRGCHRAMQQIGCMCQGILEAEVVIDDVRGCAWRAGFEVVIDGATGEGAVAEEVFVGVGWWCNSFAEKKLSPFVCT